MFSTLRPAGRRAAAFAAAAFLAALLPIPLRGQALPGSGKPLEELSLEELLKVEVTSVSGLAVEQFTAPAAVYVITGDEIRRSGMRLLSEALRLVPGMFVARESASAWTVGARGLTGLGITASRHLVLVDGRALFDPLLSIALWDVADVPVDQIERIEVINGPGATLWGANAMNGVISVVTKSARATQGGRAGVGIGDETPVVGAARWGDSHGSTAWSVWGKYFEIDDYELADGSSANDGWSSLRGGLRVDGELDRRGSWTFEASAYTMPEYSFSSREPIPGEHLQFHQVTTQDDVSGAFARFAVGRGDVEEKGWSLRGYFDWAERDTTRIGYERGIVDLDYRSWTSWGQGQDLVWGVQVDHTSDDIQPGSNFLFDPGSRDWFQWNAFFQNTSELVPERWFAMIGSKVTYHEFAGTEAQPGVRLWWTPDSRQTLWAAISRPVRIPSRLEENGMIVVAYADPGILGGGEPTGVVPFGIRGDEELDVEKLVAYELGHRWRAERWAISSALFYNDYRTLLALPQGVVGTFTDAASGESYGAEVAATIRVTKPWRLELGANWLQTDLDGPVAQFEDGGAPRWMAQIRSYVDLPHALELDGALYYVDELPARGVDAYLRLDAGIAWQPRPGWRLLLRGQNLLEPSHREGSAVEIPRNGILGFSLLF